MLVADARAGGGPNFELAVDKLAQDIGLLVVNVIYFFLAGGTRHN